MWSSELNGSLWHILGPLVFVYVINELDESQFSQTKLYDFMLHYRPASTSNPNTRINDALPG